MLSEQETLSVSDHETLTRCDRCILNFLKPNLLPIEAGGLSCTRIQQLLKQFKQALDQESIISFMPDGQVKFITDSAEKLLSQYFSYSGAKELPDTLKKWCNHQISNLITDKYDADQQLICLPLHVEQPEKQLLIYFIPNEDIPCYLLLLEEHDLSCFSSDVLELLGLTRREAEVLFWIAKDKSNAGIAKVLNCCEGTVRKHLENIYRKLGVQTRIGAVMTAMEQLGLLRE
jgi:DNA-binding CsgD family transcriptional regulator